MGIRPTVEILSPQVATPAKNSALVAPLVPQILSTPRPLATPSTTWGAKRQTRYYQALTGLTEAQSSYLLARADLAKSFVAAVRAANEVAELPEICANDTQIRRLQRERDYLNARREVEEARYGVYATQDEINKLRKPRLEHSQGHPAAVQALLEAKVDREALGEDTSDLDRTLSLLQR